MIDITKGEEINSNKNNNFSLLNTRSKISLLWIFVVINMAYADILSLMDATSPIRKIMDGASMPSGGLTVGAILMETSIVMIVLSQLLPCKINKWINILVAIINILAVLFGGNGVYYFIFVGIEVIAMIIIIWLAWKQLNEEVI